MGKINIGDQIYIISPNRSIGKYYRVSKVGKKYFYIDELPQEKFSIDNMKSICGNWSWGYKCFESKEAYELTLEIAKRRQVVNNSTHLLSDDEINTVYNMIIKKTV